jgi:hypothetical protein
MKKKIIIPIVVVLAIVFLAPKIIGYIVQGFEQPQGETNLKFSEILTGFEHQINLDKSLPFMGVAAIDIDGDGVDEIFIGGGNDQDDAFFKYTGEALEKIPSNLGLNKSSGIATFGAASIDATKDGRADLFVAREDGVFFYTNTGHGFIGRKVDFPLEKTSMPLSIALADINKDGAVDLYISNYIRNEYVEGETIFNKPYGAYSNMLLNNGDNTFKDITKSSGLYQQHNTFLAVFVDLNNDSHSDLVIAHDTGRVHIYRNNGDATFTEKENPTVFSYPMGIAVSDINNDGLMDLYFSNVGNTLPEAMVRGDIRDDQEFNTDYILLENKGNFVFEDTAQKRNAGTYGFGWGVVSYDFNNDTRSDYLITQNYARFPGVQLLSLYPGNLLQQYNDGTFKPVEKVANIENKNFGLTPVVTDFNKDGKPDVVLANINGPLRAFINQDTDDNHWLKVRLMDNPSSIGALVTVKTASGKIYTNQFYTSEGLCSDQTHEIFFGLGKEDTIKKLVVRYQDGHTDTVLDAKVNTIVNLK